ncbi:TetR/AcrR family transcriptional regulator [Streptomonospora nanhaiensis]|uniref:AcrR family transcriptional regulator n=1 Tax=Streptomonospora nanhaiensis TaxID=1323731 RepID=A0A853BI96_9ACTN|nr:TetR/AcrR family transcriptional regulator [Streptomonospora nanhaiensis]NYI94246.1 AcrR family transcriptional regulator [Streptomonospora nanhaiensis]
MSTSPRPPGRPRSPDADAAILAAALDLLIERGAEAASVEQVARRAGVTRATVYRRFPDKTRLLLAAVESAFGDPPAEPEIRDVEHLLAGAAYALAQPRWRRLLRRLYGAADDFPEVAGAYRAGFGADRDRVRRGVIERARARGEFPADTDPALVLDLLTGAVWQHLATRPDTTAAGEAEEYLRAVLRQAGYRPAAGDAAGPAGPGAP